LSNKQRFLLHSATFIHIDGRNQSRIQAALGRPYSDYYRVELKQVFYAVFIPSRASDIRIIILSIATMPVATEEHLPKVSPDKFRIAIVGGGIGGLTTALSLATYSPELTNITVYEQAPEYTEIGAGVGIGIQAGRVLQKLGVWEAANAISGERNGIHRSTRRWDSDELIVDVKAANSNGEDEVRQLWVHRAEFLEVLYAEIRRRGCAMLETDKRAVSLEV
jgi:hypothetical protein